MASAALTEQVQDLDTALAATNLIS